MSKEIIIDALNMKKYSTHVEILNDFFGRNYKGHQKATQILKDGTMIWFPKIEKNKKGEW